MALSDSYCVRHMIVINQSAVNNENVTIKNEYYCQCQGTLTVRNIIDLQFMIISTSGLYFVI